MCHSLFLLAERVCHEAVCGAARCSPDYADGDDVVVGDFVARDDEGHDADPDDDDDGGDLVLTSVPWPNRGTFYSVYPAVVFVHGNLDVWVGASLTLPTTRSSVAIAEYCSCCRRRCRMSRRGRSRRRGCGTHSERSALHFLPCSFDTLKM